MVSFSKHSCGDSRLACSDCGSTVCPKCMVECPVGNRCKKCAAKTESHILKVTPVIALKTFLVAAIAGYLFTCFGAFGGFSFYSWIIVYFVGTLVGNLIHRISGYKMGAVIVSVVISGIAVGAIANPDTLINPLMKPDAVSSMDVAEMMSELQEMDADSEDELPGSSKKTHRKGKNTIKSEPSDENEGSRSPAKKKTSDDSKLDESATKAESDPSASTSKNDSNEGKSPSDASKSKSEPGQSESESSTNTGKNSDKVANADSSSSEDVDSTDGAESGNDSELKKQRMKMREEKARALAKSMSSTRHFWKLVDLLIFVVGVLTPFTGIVPNIPFYGFRR